MSVKPRRQSNAPIRTVRDARRDKLAAEAAREYRAAVKYLRTKVRHWEQQVAKYDGDAHRMVLAKYRAMLADLTGERAE